MKMRTLFSVGLAIGLVVACWGIAVAGFSPIDAKTVAGQVAFTAAPSGTMAVALRNISDNSAVAELSWSDVTPGPSGTGWKHANQYIEVTNTYNRTGWGIQIYTNNCVLEANPRFYIANPTDVNPAGLVATDDRKSVLPLAWRIMGERTTKEHLGIREVSDPAAPNKHHLQSTDFPETTVYYPWVWMKDARTPAISELYTTAFVNGEDYVTIWNENGVHHAEGPLDYYVAPSPNYVYIGARFTTATTPRIYRTSKLTLELFYE